MIYGSVDGPALVAPLAALFLAGGTKIRPKSRVYVGFGCCKSPAPRNLPRLIGGSATNRVRSAMSSSAMRVHSRSSATSGSTGSSRRKKRPSVRKASASTQASRRSSLAPASEKRSRKRSSCLGLRECTMKPRSIRVSTTGPVRHLERHCDRARRRPGLPEEPRRQIGKPKARVREGSLAMHAALSTDDADMVNFRSPVHHDKPFDRIHRILGRMVHDQAAAMLTKPCTGARRRKLPTGRPSQPMAGARVSRGAQGAGGVWLLPTDWPTPPGTGEDQMMVVETMGPIAPSGCPCALRAPGQPEGACQRPRNTECMGEQVQGGGPSITTQPHYGRSVVKGTGGSADDAHTHL